MTKNAENPVSDLLVEASSTAAALILKRRKLLRNGGSVFVSLLKKVETHSWLKVSIPVSDISRNGWDLAHEIATRYKKELGSTPYIEPDKTGGRYDNMNSTGRERRADQDATKSAFSGYDAQSMVNNLMPQMDRFNGAGLPGGFNIPGMPSFGSQGQGFGLPSGFGGTMGGPSGPGASDPFAAAGFGRGGSAGGALNPNSEIMEILKGTGLGSETREFSVPALQEVPGWAGFHANKAKMLEVEAAQLLLSQMPGVAPEMHSKESLRAVAEMDACSKVLRRFLEALPESALVEDTTRTAVSE